MAQLNHSHFTPAENGNSHGHDRMPNGGILNGTGIDPTCPCNDKEGLPRAVNTLVVGSGPSALFLSYLLHGNVPYYDWQTSGPHPDPIIHEYFSKYPDQSLYDVLATVGVDNLTRHFDSNLSYAKQAFRLNILLDTLLRPNGDLEANTTLSRSRIEFRHDDSAKVSHLVVGKNSAAGGQWSETAVDENALTLSYADMLGLPSYSVSQYIQETEQKELPAFTRLTRKQVKGYYARYPSKVGIDDTILSKYKVASLSRISFGRFDVLLRSHNHFHHIICNRLVLASGLFSDSLPPPKILAPLIPLSHPNYSLPVLVLGSGFTAADSVLYHLSQHRRVVHIYKWDPEISPNPLKACHPQAYPDYAFVYSCMKRKKAENYSGYPNAIIRNVKLKDFGLQVTFDQSNGDSLTLDVGSVQTFIGRRARVDYLLPGLKEELKGLDIDENGFLLREGFYPLVVKAMQKGAEKDSAQRSLGFEVMHNVWVVGSLTGDSSLVRFGLGGVIGAAYDLRNRS